MPPKKKARKTTAVSSQEKKLQSTKKTAANKPAAKRSAGYRRSNRRQSSPEYKTGDLDTFLSNRRKQNIAQQTQIDRSRRDSISVSQHTGRPDDSSASDTDTENIADWYSNRGARRPYSSEMDSTRNTPTPKYRKARGKAQSKTTNEESKITRLKSDSKLIYDALLERNINVKKLRDDNIINIQQKILHPSEISTCTQTGEEETWESDLLKCQSSHEALFQRTIMMDLIDRCHLHSLLDYVCEVSWIAKPVPSKDQSVEIVEPVPDLAVAFRTISLITDEMYLPELGPLRYHMCPEGVVDDSCERAFHFFSVEVKGKRGDIEVAKKQNLITASQALYNIYLFMKEADQIKIFFDQVRFYSVAAAGNYFEIRVHRAVEVEERLWVTSEYSLGYNFDIVFAWSGGGYRRSEAVGMVKNILCEYGVGELHEILKGAVEKVLKKFGEAKMKKRTAADHFELPSSQRQRLDPDNESDQ